MYGRIGKIIARPDARESLIGILLEGIDTMPGCLSYVVAKGGDENTIWVTEVWRSEEDHRNSLTLPSVRDAISRAMPLIASFEEGTKTVPVGGHGLVYVEEPA